MAASFVRFVTNHVILSNYNGRLHPVQGEDSIKVRQLLDRIGITNFNEYVIRLNGSRIPEDHEITVCCETASDYQLPLLTLIRPSEDPDWVEVVYARANERYRKQVLIDYVRQMAGRGSMLLNGMPIISTDEILDGDVIQSIYH